MMAVSVVPGPTLQVGDATELHEGPYFNPRVLRSYDVSSDGQRFLRVKIGNLTVDETAEVEAVLVQSWFDELERLVPVP